MASPGRALASSSRCPKKRALMIRPGMIPCRHRLLSVSLSLIRLICSEKGAFAVLGVVPRAAFVRDMRAFHNGRVVELPDAINTNPQKKLLVWFLLGRPAMGSTAPG